MSDEWFKVRSSKFKVQSSRFKVGGVGERSVSVSVRGCADERMCGCADERMREESLHES